MEMYIVLAVTLFMMIMFIWHKVPFGVTTMTCCIILAAAGIFDVKTAFSGFGNQIVVLIAPMLALSAVLGKTSLVAKISGLMDIMKNKRGILLVLTFYIVGAIFAQFIPSTAVLTIMVVFLTTLGNTGDITTKRIGLYEGIISDPQYALTMMDPFIYAIPSMIVLTLYCLFAWKLMPKEGAVDQSALKQSKKVETLSAGQEKIVYAVFVLVMVLMILNKWTGVLLYLAPGIGVLLLIYCGVLKVDEAVKSMTSDMVWMIAGVLVVADALGQSGAGDAIGNLVLDILGNHPGSFTVMLVFSAATVIMTTFISNMATQTVLIPIAASVALAGGWDPRGLVLIIGTANMFAVGFPSGSGEAAVAFAAGGYNPIKVLKFTVPYMLLSIVTCALTAEFMYPLY